MKLRNLVVSGILVGSLLFTGCQSTQEDDGQLSQCPHCNANNSYTYGEYEEDAGAVLFKVTQSELNDILQDIPHNDNVQAIIDGAFSLGQDVYNETHCHECASVITWHLGEELYGGLLTYEDTTDFTNQINEHLSRCSYHHNELDIPLAKFSYEYSGVEYEDPSDYYTDTCGSCGSSNIEIMDSCGAYQCYDCGFID